MADLTWRAARQRPVDTDPTLALLTAVDPGTEYAIRLPARPDLAAPASTVHSLARDLAGEVGAAEVRRRFRDGWLPVARYTSTRKTQETR